MKKNLNRKDFLLVSAGLAATAMVSRIGATEGHKHHDGNAKHAALISAAMDCLNKSQICLDHCIVSLREKDLSLVECLASVREMIPICSTLGSLAAYDSKRLSAFAKVCIAACQDCMKECEKHSKKHQSCKDCADSCKACISECKKVA